MCICSWCKYSFVVCLVVLSLCRCSKGKGKGKGKGQDTHTHTHTTPESNVLKTKLNNMLAIKEDLEQGLEDNGGQATKVMLDGKSVLITRKDRREHMAMLQTSQAIN